MKGTIVLSPPARERCIQINTTYIGSDINTENTTTGYHSGQVFQIDGNLAQHFSFGKGFAAIGVSGFYLNKPEAMPAALRG